MSTEIIDPTPDSLTPAPLGVQGDGEPKTNPPANPNGEPPAGEELDPETGEPKKKMGGFQKRIQKLTTRLAAQEEEIARLRAGASAPNRQPEALTEPQPPDENSFNSYAEFKAAERKYFSDLADFKAEQKLLERDKAKEQHTAAEKARERENEAQANWTKQLEAAHAAHPDLEELLEEDLPATPAMMQTIVASAYGGEMLHHLASHPEECRRIASLTPHGQQVALGRIEDEISARKTNPEPQKRTTSAPAPLQPLKGSGTVTKDPAKQSDAEWLRSQRPARR